MTIKCPKCGNDDHAHIIMVEYWGGLSYHYDGVSEYRCQKCQSRWGRWTGTLLADNEVESPFGRYGHLEITKDGEVVRKLNTRKRKEK